MCEPHHVHYKGLMFLYIQTILDERHSQLHVYNNTILNTQRRISKTQQRILNNVDVINPKIIYFQIRQC